MRLLLAAVATTAALGLGAAPALAHHGLAQQFNMEKRVVLKGKITKVHWQNPHIYYSLEVMENGKPRIYNIESVPVAMARAGGLTAQKLRNDGKEVEVHVRPGLKDPNVVWGLYLKFTDGSVVTFEGFKE
jgi:hypothetical protein